jgi:hypothetical protein
MMAPCPFNPETLERLLRGELPPEQRRAVLDHLAGDCPDCEDFFAGLGDATGELLAKFYLARADGADDESAVLPAEARARIFAAVEAEFAAPAAVRPRFTRASRRVFALAAGLVLAVSLSLGAYHLLQKPGPTVKGPEIAIDGPVFLQFLVIKAAPEGSEPVIVRGVNHAVYSERDRVMFRFRIDQPAYVHIVRVGPEGKPEVIFPASANALALNPPGVYDANQDDQLMVYPLKDLDGLQNFCAAAGAWRTSEQIVANLTAIIQDQHRDQPSRVRNPGIDCFQIKVEKQWSTEGLKRP